MRSATTDLLRLPPENVKYLLATVGYLRNYRKPNKLPARLRLDRLPEELIGISYSFTFAVADAEVNQSSTPLDAKVSKCSAPPTGCGRGIELSG